MLSLSRKYLAWVLLQTMLFLSTTYIVFSGVILFYTYRKAVYKVLGVSVLTDSNVLLILSYQERVAFTLYGIAVIITVYRHLSYIKEGTFNQTLKGEQLFKEIVSLSLFVLLPLILATINLTLLRQILFPRQVYTAGLLTLLISSIVEIVLSKQKDIPYVIRGERLLAHAEALAVSKELIRGDPFPFYWGGVWLRSEEATKHLAIIGEPGSGKSHTIRLLMESTLRWIGQGHDHRAVIYDPKRNTVSMLAGMKLNYDVHILDPFDQRGVAWNIAKDIDDPDIAKTVANALIPADKNATQPYFRNTAATIVSAVIQALGIKKPGIWTLRDLVLVMRSAKSIRDFLVGVPETEHYIAQHCEEIGQTFQSVLSEAAGKIDWLDTVAASWEKAEQKISLGEWLNEESILLLGSDNLREVAMSNINRMMLSFLTLAILDLPDDKQRRNWFFLDEFSSLGRIERIKELLYKGRSKGVCVMIAFQEIAQLVEDYKEEGQRIITANTANKIFLRSTDPKTQKWEEEYFGKQEKYESSHSKSSSSLFSRRSTTWGKTESIRERPLVMASEFGTLHLANEKDGISGFAKTQSIGSYRFNAPAEMVSNLPKADGNVSDFCSRDPADRKIKPFSDEEKIVLFSQEQAEPLVKAVPTKVRTRSVRRKTRTVGQKEKALEGLKKLANWMRK